jgi:TatA/E family protein of Tat protein translocase
MGPLGFPELIIIFVVALLVFGPRKLPELGRSLGKGLSEFKRASNDLRNTLDDEIRDEERRSVLTSPPTPAAPEPVASTAVNPTDLDTIRQSQPVADPEAISRGQHA